MSFTSFFSILTLTLLSAINIASAATSNFDLTGSTGSLVLTSETDNSRYYGNLKLINSASGKSYIPSFTISAGDTISGSITLDSYLTIPNSTRNMDIEIQLGLLQGLNTSVSYDYNIRPCLIGSQCSKSQYFSFFNDGIAVSIPYTPLVGSAGGITLGNYSLFDTSGFTFNKIVFSVDVLGVEADGLAVNGLTTLGVTPNLSFGYSPAVPLPSAIWFFCPSLIGLAGLAKKQKAA